MNVKLRSMVAITLASTSLMSVNALADSTSDLVQALVSKGVLTEEEGALLTKGRAEEMSVQKAKEKKNWTSHVNIRGYVQTRATKMLGGDEGVNLWSDRSVGDDRSLGGADKNLLIRRARVIIYGDYGDHLSYYIQPDFASSPQGASGGGFNYAQLRDAYGDINIDSTKVHRFRVGQSKVPFGFENLQSSSNRLTPDRNDALNSAVKDERDLGVFYYYTPQNIQALFEEIGKQGLKHSGNYGMLGGGFYNGQGANARDTNDNYHFVARATYPWKTESGQIYEASIQGYHGQYVPSTGTYNRNLTGATSGSTPTIEGGGAGRYRNGFTDERVGVSFIMYPQPFGLQAEWNWGKTPGLDITQNRIEEKSLNGGYVMAMYKIDNWNNWGTFIPFVKWQYFDGFNKAETNAPENHVNDWEAGVEWQIAPEVEISAEYHKMKRTNLVNGNTAGRQDYQTFDADALRVQLQYNF